MLTQALILALGALALAGYIAEAEVFAPVMRPVENWLINSLEKSAIASTKPEFGRVGNARWRLADWFYTGITCRICVGQWVIGGGHWFLGGGVPWGWGRLDWWLMLVSSGIHIVGVKLTDGVFGGDE